MTKRPAKSEDRPWSPYLYRGVYRGPYLSPAGNVTLFAVDYEHRLVPGSEVELEPGQPEQPTVNALWRMLDKADPEHARRRSVAVQRGTVLS
jgi:hypothetical protein